MKTKIFLTVTALFLIIGALGQKPTLELTFTAKNDGNYIPLDSILIRNLTQHVDTMLYAPDTVLVLDYITSISSNEVIEKNSFTLSQNFPNPFNGETTINLNLLKNEHITITIHDISGRELSKFSITLNRGNHSFIFYSGNEGYYLFTARGKHACKTIKMINADSNPGFASQCKLVYSAYTETVINSKSQEAIDNFGFSLGDYLRFIGFAKNAIGINGSDVIVDAPQSNELYEFDISEGIPCPGIPTITYNFQIYNTVLIGSQCWMKENLNAGVKVDGSHSNNGVIEKYCYDNDEAYCDEYGGLYRWTEMMQYNYVGGDQGICPEGWHIPTEFEWQELEIYIGMPPCQVEWGGWRGINEGWKLKASSGWLNNGNGIDSVGFRGIPGGNRAPDASFENLSIFGSWWSSTEMAVNEAWYRSLSYNFIKVCRGHAPMSFALSVRCLKD